MSSTVPDSISPRHIVLPTRIVDSADPHTGDIHMSGAALVWWNGSAWDSVSGTNTGD